MKNKKRYIAIFSLLLVALLICLLPNVFIEDRLTEKDLYELRKTYPRFNGAYDSPTLSMINKKLTLRDYIIKSDTFIYGEITGAAILEDVIIKTGIKEFDDNMYKDVTYGFIRYLFPIKVISDTEGLFNKGEEIYFCYGIMEQDYCPFPKQGEKVVIPIEVGIGDNEGVFFSGAIGYYYVTDKDYVISAFNESGEYIYSGKRTENLLKSLKKTQEELIKYNDTIAYRYENYDIKSDFVDIDSYKDTIKNELIPKNQEMVKSLKENSLAEK